MKNPEQWWAKGLLFENCNCQLLCPGHISLNNRCTYERCIGYWAIHIEDGSFGRIPLKGLTAVILNEGPQRMIEGGFTQAIYIDDMADNPQRTALDQIFRGQAGGEKSRPRGRHARLRGL